MTTRSARSITVLVALVALVGGLYWLLFILEYGLSFSQDSTDYMMSALRMRYAADYYVNPLWPPLYSLLLSVFMLFKPFPADAAALFAGLSIVIQLVLLALTLRRIGTDWIAQILAIVALATFAPFLYMYKWVWSEVPFSLLTTAAFYFLLRHIDNRKILDFALCTLFVALASLTRYIGISTLVILLGYAVFVVFTASDRRVAARNYISLSAAGFAPLLIYLVWNRARSGTFFGERVASDVTVGENIRLVLQTLFGDFGVWMLLLLVIAVGLYAWMFSRRSSDAVKRRLTAMTFMLSFAILYTGLVIYSASSAKIDPIDTRYFSPVHFIPFLFILCGFEWFLPRWASAKSGVVQKNIPRVVLYGLVLGLIVANLGDVSERRRDIEKNRDIGTSHHEAGYDKSPTAVELAKLFNLILERDGELTITVVHDYVKIPPRPSVGRSLFFRESSIRYGNNGGFKFEQVGDGEFTLWLTTKDGRRKPIRYKSLPPVNSEVQLVSELRALMEREGIDHMWLLLYRHLTMLFGERIDEVAASELEVPYKLRIIPYSIHELRLRD